MPNSKTPPSAAATPTRRPAWVTPLILLLVLGLLGGVYLIWQKQADPDTTGTIPADANSSVTDTAPPEQPDPISDESAAPTDQPIDDKPTQDATGTRDQAADVIAALADLKRLDPDDPMSIGDVAAPIILIAYSDYQCAFCQLWSHETLPTLREKYIDTGKLRLELRDLPILGPESFLAAQAARAAGAQGKYWEYHERLFQRAKVKDPDSLTLPKLLEYAAELDLDTNQFEADLAAESYRSAVTTDLEEATAIGVNATPGFLLNGIPILGAQPLEIFVKEIEDLLAGKSPLDALQ